MLMPVNVKVVSVVRDYEMYAQCLSGNPCCRELTLVPLDNRTGNLPVPVLYNRFLDTCTEDCWIVFCHEDWQPVCDLRQELEPLDKNCLYGPVGIYLETCDRADFLYIRGFVAQFRKDGRHHKTIHGVLPDGPVDTFDCQCLMVHSSLVRRYGLRFDERLAFDLYVEDFCAAARERFDIESRSVTFPCRHYSSGTIGDRFRKTLAYVQEKFHGSRFRHASIVGHLNTFGGDPQKPVYNVRRSWLTRVRRFFKK